MRGSAKVAKISGYCNQVMESTINLGRERIRPQCGTSMHLPLSEKVHSKFDRQTKLLSRLHCLPLGEFSHSRCHVISYLHIIRYL